IPMPRALVRTLIVLVAIAAVAGGAAAYSQYRPLRIAALEPQENVAVTVFGLGTVEARVLARIGFKVTGTLIDLRADHGDHVRAGQVLARIDASEQQARVAKARAQLEIATAAAQVAEAALRKAASVAAQRSQISQRRQELL